MRTPLDECLRKFVVVEAAGVKYLGTLIEVGEEEIILKTPARWIGVPIDRISYVREIDPVVHENPTVEQVDAETYVASPEAEPAPAESPASEAEPPSDETNDRPPATDE